MPEFSWEELARTLFEEMADALILFDPETEMPLDVNPMMQKLTKLPRQELLSRELSFFLRAENGRRLDEMQYAIRNTTFFHSQEGFLLRETLMDRWRPVNITVTRLHALERPLGLLVVRDISSRVLAEAERNQLQRQLLMAQKLEAVGKLSSGVAHELNNLMTVALGCVAQLERAPDQEEAQQSVNVLREVISQGTGLARSLLRFGRQLPPKMERVDLREVVRQGIRVLRNVLGDMIDLCETGDWDFPLWVNADRGQLQQIMMNLGLNAKAAMPTGGVLTVALKTILPSLKVALTLQDSGQGIDPQVLPRLFEPFFSHRKPGEGIGLGLSIVKDIVEAHNGTIDVQSTVGVGTTVRMEFPLRVDAPLPPVREAPEPIEKAIAIVVKPAGYIRDVLTSALRTFGFDVCNYSTVEGADLALEQFRQQIRLLVVDLEDGVPDHWNAIDTIPMLVVASDKNSSPLPTSPLRRVLDPPFRMSEFRQCVQELLST